RRRDRSEHGPEERAQAQARVGLAADEAQVEGRLETEDEPAPDEPLYTRLIKMGTDTNAHRKGCRWWSRRRRRRRRTAVPGTERVVAGVGIELHATDLAGC